MFTLVSHALDWGLVRASKALDYQEIGFSRGKIVLFIDKKLENTYFFSLLEQHSTHELPQSQINPSASHKNKTRLKPMSSMI